VKTSGADMAPEDSTPDTTKHNARASEDEAEKLDRELIELLNELRVVMPGVQLLFGFLLTVPFQQRFGEVTDFQKAVYFATLLLTAGSAACLMAPSAFHRLTFREHQKPYLVDLATRQTIAGLVLVALAMTGAVMLLTDVLFGAVVVAVVTAGTAAVFCWLWFGLAWRRMASGKREW
jgi:O-antigen/teichoic acid export membrane protein